MSRHAVLLGALLLGSSADCKTADPASRAGQALEAQLRKQQSGAAVTVDVGPGPLGTRVVTAAVKGAYPGTGVMRVVVDADGKSYGVHGEHDLADLLRARGLIAAPPAIDDLVRLVNAAQFEGLLAIDDQEPPSVSKTDDGLELKLVRLLMPSGARERVVVRIPGKTGQAQVTFAAIASGAGAGATGGGGAAPANAPAGDPIATAEQALAAKDAFGLTRAIRALHGNTDPRARSVIARATLVGNDKVAADAMLALGSDEPTAKLLVETWKATPAGLRDKLVKIAIDLHGAPFGALLKK